MKDVGINWGIQKALFIQGEKTILSVAEVEEKQR